MRKNVFSPLFVLIFVALGACAGRQMHTGMSGTASCGTLTSQENTRITAGTAEPIVVPTPAVEDVATAPAVQIAAAEPVVVPTPVVEDVVAVPAVEIAAAEPIVVPTPVVGHVAKAPAARNRVAKPVVVPTPAVEDVATAPAVQVPVAEPIAAPSIADEDIEMAPSDSTPLGEVTAAQAEPVVVPTPAVEDVATAPAVQITATEPNVSTTSVEEIEPAPDTRSATAEPSVAPTEVEDVATALAVQFAAAEPVVVPTPAVEDVAEVPAPSAAVDTKAEVQLMIDKDADRSMQRQSPVAQAPSVVDTMYFPGLVIDRSSSGPMAFMDYDASLDPAAGVSDRKVADAAALPAPATADPVPSETPTNAATVAFNGTKMDQSPAPGVGALFTNEIAGSETDRSLLVGVIAGASIFGILLGIFLARLAKRRLLVRDLMRNNYKDIPDGTLLVQEIRGGVVFRTFSVAAKLPAPKPVVDHAAMESVIMKWFEKNPSDAAIVATDEACTEPTPDAKTPPAQKGAKPPPTPPARPGVKVVKPPPTLEEISNALDDVEFNNAICAAVNSSADYVQGTNVIPAVTGETTVPQEVFKSVDPPVSVIVTDPDDPTPTPSN